MIRSLFTSNSPSFVSANSFDPFLALEREPAEILSYSTMEKLFYNNQLNRIEVDEEEGTFSEEIEASIVEADISLPALIPATLAVGGFNNMIFSNEKNLDINGEGPAGHSALVGQQIESESSYSTTSTFVESGLIVGGAIVGGVEGAIIGAGAAAVYAEATSPDTVSIPNDAGSETPANQII